MKTKTIFFLVMLAIFLSSGSSCNAKDLFNPEHNCNCHQLLATSLEGGAQGNIIQAQVEQQGGPVNILFVLDASYSMKEHLGKGDNKMEAAKRVLQDALTRIPSDINLGLRVFGENYTGNSYTDCQQTELLVALGQGNRRSIIERIAPVHPYGLTPLTYSLMMAQRDLSTAVGSRTLILITDGAETCGGNPCEYIRRLKQTGVNLKIDIVGLGLKRDRAARSQLNCIADVSGGKYYDAGTADELIESITRSVSAAVSGRVIITKPKVEENTRAPEKQ